MGVILLMHDDSYITLFAFWKLLCEVVVVSRGFSYFRTTVLLMGAPTRVPNQVT